MGTKAKGTRAERELMHKFYNTGSWIAIRAAGSGSTPLPCPDILAGNSQRKLAIECKSIKGKSYYFDKKEINKLLEFSKLFGAEAWIGVRFDNLGWYFVLAENLDLSKKNKVPSINIKSAQNKGLKFEELILKEKNSNLY